MKQLLIFLSLILCSALIVLATDVQLGRLQDLTWTGSGTTRTGQFTTVATTTTTTQPGWSDTNVWAILIEYDTTNATSYLDTSGNSLNATNIATVQTIAWTSGVGYTNVGATFDGIDDQCVVPFSPLLNLTNDATIVLWINSGDLQGEVISHFNAAAPYEGWGCLVGSPVAANGIPYAYLGDWTGGQHWGAGAGAYVVASNVWHFLAYRYTHVSTNIEFFIDAVSAGSYTFPSVRSAPNSVLYIGRDSNTSPTRPWGGTNDFVALCNYQLNNTAISNLYLNTHPTNYLRIR